MRRAALALLFCPFASTAAISPDRSAAQQQAGTDRQDRHDTRGARRPLSGHDAADGRRIATSRARSSASTRPSRFRGPGDFVLLYPKWVPGGHSPRNDIKNITGFRPSANGRELEWVRDTLDVYAFHIDVPAGRQARSTSTSNMSRRRTNNQGRDRGDPGPGEHPVDRPTRSTRPAITSGTSRCRRR